jgi:hypothetical protein
VGVGATGGEKCLGATPGFGSFFGAAGGTLCIVEGVDDIADMLGMLCLRGGTSILLLFPTNCCGGFLFQFF